MLFQSGGDSRLAVRSGLAVGLGLEERFLTCPLCPQNPCATGIILNQISLVPGFHILIRIC